MILALPFPSSPSDSVDQSTLHTLLSGYLQILEHNPDLRGKLLLIDEDTGEVLGEIDAGELGVDDVTAEGKANEPVVIDLERVDGRYVAGIKVTEVPKEEMDDWMLKGAASISCVPCIRSYSHAARAAFYEQDANSSQPFSFLSRSPS